MSVEQSLDPSKKKKKKKKKKSGDNGKKPSLTPAQLPNSCVLMPLPHAAHSSGCRCHAPYRSACIRACARTFGKRHQAQGQGVGVRKVFNET